MNEDEQLEEFVNLSFFGRSRDRDGDPGMDGKGIHRPHFGGNVVRHVRTPAGADFYGQPVGSVITKDQINKAERENARHGIKPPKGGLSAPSHVTKHDDALNKPGSPAKVSDKGPTAIQPLRPTGSTGSSVQKAPPAPGPIQPGAARQPGAPRPIPGLRLPVPPRTPSTAPKPAPGASGASGVLPEKPIQSTAHTVKNIAPTIKGPLTFNVRGGAFSAPTGSTIVRMKSDPEALAFVKAPDGTVHAFNHKGEVTIPPVVAEVLAKKFSTGLKDDPNYELAKFDNQDAVPQLKDAKAGAQLHSETGPEFQMQPTGSWKHTATGTTHDASELDDSYHSGELSYKPAGGEDLAAMDQASFVKAVTAMPEGKQLQFVNPRTGEVATLTKNGDKWSSSKASQATMAATSLYYLRKHLSGEDDPTLTKQVAKATKEGLNKPGARPVAKAAPKPPVKKAVVAAAKKATPAAKPAVKKTVAPAKKAPAKLNTTTHLHDIKGAQTRWATPAEAKKLEAAEKPLDDTAPKIAPKVAPKGAEPKAAPKVEAPKAKPVVNVAVNPLPKTGPDTELARNLRPGDQFGGGTVVSVHQHPQMPHRVVVRFTGKDGMVRQTDWNASTKISLFKRAEAKVAPKVEAPKAPEPKAEEPGLKAGARLGAGGLRDLKPGGHVTVKFTPNGGSALQAHEDRYQKHEDGSFRHLNGDNIPMGPSRLAMLHGDRSHALTLEEDNPGGHSSHPHVDDVATSTWAKDAAAGSTMLERGRTGRVVWTKQHDGEWHSDKGEVISSHDVGEADHSGLSIGPHTLLPAEPKPGKAADEPKTGEILEHPTPEGMKVSAPAAPDLKLGDPIPHEQWLHDAPVETSVRYMRRDGSSSLYTKNNANEWVTTVGTRVPSKHLGKEATLGQLRFRSYPPSTKPAMESLKPPTSLTRAWFEAQPEGTMIEHNGHVFLKQGGKWVQEDGKSGPHDNASMMGLFFKE